MILGFKTQVKGKPTYFPQKIKAGIKIHTMREGKRWKPGMKIHMATGVRTSNYMQFNKGIKSLQYCVSTQDIYIIRSDDSSPSAYGDKLIAIDFYSDFLRKLFRMAFRVRIDARYLTKNEAERLAINDGFDSLKELFGWFGYDDFSRATNTLDGF